jgi:hypothetical protein
MHLAAQIGGSGYLVVASVDDPLDEVFRRLFAGRGVFKGGGGDLRSLPIH